MTGRDNWDGNEFGLQTLLKSVNATMFWQNGAQLPPLLAEEESYPPKTISSLSLAVVPQGELGLGVCI